MRTNHRVMRSVLWSGGLAVLALALILIWPRVSIPASSDDGKSADNPSTQTFKQVAIDLDKAVKVTLPNLPASLSPVVFRTSDGKTGWVPVAWVR